MNGAPVFIYSSLVEAVSQLYCILGLQLQVGKVLRAYVGTYFIYFKCLKKTE